MSKNQSRASATQKVTKFDSSPYEQEQNQIKNEMNKAQVKLVSQDHFSFPLLIRVQTEVKDKIALIVSGGAGAAKETALRAEIDTLRNEQINNRIIQSNTQAEAKRQQEEIEKKVCLSGSLSVCLCLTLCRPKSCMPVVKKYQQRA